MSTEAPERIYINEADAQILITYGSETIEAWTSDKCIRPTDTEYIRADIQQEKIDKLVAACESGFDLLKVCAGYHLGQELKPSTGTMVNTINSLREILNFAKT